MVVLIEGNENKEEISDEQIKERLLYYMDYGISKKTAIELTKNDLKIGKNQVYKVAQDL